MSVSAADAAEPDANAQLNFANNEKVICSDIQDFNNGVVEEYLDYDFAAVDYPALKYLDTEKIHELMDNGVVLCVSGSDSVADIYQDLNIDSVPQQPTVTGVKVLGTFIYQQNGDYIAGLMGEAEATETKRWKGIDNLISDHSEKTDTSLKINRVDVSEFSKAIRDFRRNYNRQAYQPIQETTVYFQFPTRSNHGSPYTLFTNITCDNVTVGSIAVAQYRYDICVYREDGVNKAITDIVSQMTVSAAGNVYVNHYTTRMHANISNMTIIGQSYLNSNASAGYTLSGGIGTNGTAITGSVNASTTNTYTTNNQNITNDFLAEKYKNWVCDPTVNWKSASWEVEPAIRIRNDHASQWKNQAYSSVRAARWDKGDFWGTYYTLNNPIEMGGSW